MHRAFLLFASATIAAAAEPPGSHIKQPHWDHVTFAMYANGQPKFQASSVRRNGDELFGDLSYSNSDYGKRVPPPVTIRGTQLSDGSFWPHVTLQVGDRAEGPWKTIGRSHLSGKQSSGPFLLHLRLPHCVSISFPFFHSYTGTTSAELFSQTETQRCST
jgi:hypothetical protein